MGKKKKNTKQDLISQEEKYVAFLKKRINSKNYQKTVSKEVLEKDKQSYENAKLKLRVLKGE
jgi:hypothetical protein